MEHKLLKFEADWCGPCRVMSPVVKKVIKEYDDIELVQINIDSEEGQTLARKYSVRNIPTLILLDNSNNIINTMVGTATESQVRIFLSK